MSVYEFTVDWFSQNIPTWEKLFEAFKPKRVLEIGAYEGRATCWMLERGVTRIHVIDTWEGGQEHSDVDMREVERRFIHNVKIAKQLPGEVKESFVYRGASDAILRREYDPAKCAAFDLIYIDGSHAAKDVLTDAVLCYPLLKEKGLLIFDDYLWKVGKEGEPFNPLDAPGMAIDAFAQIFAREMGEIRGLPLYQRYFVKVG